MGFTLDPQGLAQHLIRVCLIRTGVVYELFLLLDDYSTLDVGCRFINGCDIYALVRTNNGLFLCRKLYEWLTTIRLTVLYPIACTKNATTLFLLKSAIDTAKPEPEKEKLKIAANAYYNGQSITVETSNNNSKDTKIYQTNKSGMIDVRDFSGHPAAKFIVADGQNVPEEFLSPRAATSLFNIAQKYSETYPSDVKIVFTAGSASNGKPGICGAEPCHRSHQQGSCVDIRYMSSGGKDIKSDTAYKEADVPRTVWLIKAFGKDGLTKVYTGDDTRFGLPDKTPKSRSDTEVVHRHHLHCGY
ncbi:MAG: hypothetical protein HC846_06885 [Blastocatellia bacterium]|nr:hypothetical protein [Blastocatellia bacterium]